MSINISLMPTSWFLFVQFFSSGVTFVNDIFRCDLVMDGLRQLLWKEVFVCCSNQKISIFYFN
jgi:hypothetical protein